MWNKLWTALTVNDVTAGESEHYPDLRPPVVSGTRQETMQLVEDVFEGMGTLWTLESVEPDERILTGTVRTSLFGFVDDFEVRIRAVGDGAEPLWEIVARSHSRVGKGDLGKNARNIRRFYRELKKQCPPEHGRSRNQAD